MEDRNQNRNQNRNPNPNPNQQNNLASEVKELKKLFNERFEMLHEALKNKTELVPCGFCDGTGKEKRADGEWLSDENNRLVPCQVCNGIGKARR